MTFEDIENGDYWRSTTRGHWSYFPGIISTSTLVLVYTTVLRDFPFCRYHNIWYEGIHLHPSIHPQALSQSFATCCNIIKSFSLFRQQTTPDRAKRTHLTISINTNTTMSTSSNESSNLIVDFPSYPRQRNGPRTSSKSVRFATHYEGVYVDYPSEEVSKRWYSEKEMKHFKHRIGQDSMLCSKVIMDIRDGAVTVEDEVASKKFLVNCVGLEHLISRDVPKRYNSIKKGRKEHSRLVLGEQKRQKNTCDVSSVMLAHVSKRSSEPSYMRAHNIAMMRESIIVWRGWLAYLANWPLNIRHWVYDK